MANYVASSFGRTRQLKNLVGKHEGEVDVVAVASLTDSSDGYSTENQRFLHVLAIDKNSSTALTVTIYGYAHAFGKWFPLETISTATLDSSDNPGNVAAGATVTAPDTGTAEGSQTAAQRKMAIFEIAGIDRVAFVGTTADVRVLAASSTF
jgi:hypothetical protein